MRAEFTSTILRQPEALRTSAVEVRQQLAALDPRPWQDGVLGVVGMGASLHASRLLVELLSRQGRRATALSAGAFTGQDRTYRPADSYVLISESGESVEVIEAATQLRDAPTLAITNAVPSPLTNVTDAHLDLRCGMDSAVYTVGYTTTLQALALLTEWLGTAGPDSDVSQIPRYAEQLQEVDDGLAASADRIAQSRTVDVVGHGAHFGSAGEMALMIREACRLPSGCYDTYEYLHGPMEWLDSHSACIIFGSDREIELAEFVAGTGAATVLVTQSAQQPTPALHLIKMPPLGLAAATVLETLPMHQLLRHLAAARHLTIDGFRYHQNDRKISTAGN